MRGASNEKKTWDFGCAYICVWSCIGHGQDERTGMFQLKVFVLKANAVNGHATRTVKIGKISTLNLEVQ